MADPILLTLRVNGQTQTVAAPPAWTLLEVLRYKLRLIGTKQGCDKGDCGACTVLQDGQPVLSCCVLAATAQDSEITTIEGLPLDLPRAFDDAGAMQCGFCQPGMIVSAHALLEHQAEPDDGQIRQALAGNLCRCTGYTKIIDGVRLASARRVAQGADPARLGPGVSATRPSPGHLAVGGFTRKPDGLGKVLGTIPYADDLSPPGMLHGRILRSPFAHARIKGIDVSAARALPGVRAIMVGTDLPTTYGVIPWTPDENALCIDKVRYVGDGVAAVAADDEETAIRACDLIRVDYEVLPAVLDLDTAESPDAPLVHEQDWKGRPWKDNCCKEVALSFGEVDEGLARADAAVDETWFFEGTTHAAIEPHCAVAEWAPQGRITVWSATQVPHYLHRELAVQLQVPESRVRVIKPAVGAGFGGKSEVFDLELCSAWLARATGRPVKILYTREEVFYAHRGRHPMEMRMQVGAMADGTLTAVDDQVRIDGGAYHSFGMVTTYYAGQLLTGPVHLPTYRFRARRFYTNKPCCGPKRGHGSVQPRFALECALDELSEKLGLDPIELRRKNALVPGTETVNGMAVPSMGFLACLDAVESASGWKERRGKLPFGRGLGIACSMYISGTAYPIQPSKLPQSGVQLQADRSGRITVLCGASDIGQGSDAMLATIVTEETGLPPDDVLVLTGDTALTPVDLGSYSSRVTYMVGLAAQEAARDMRVQMLAALARRWEVSADDLEVAVGHVFLRSEPGRSMATRDVLQLAEEDLGRPLGTSGGYRTRAVGGSYRGGAIGASPAYSATAHIAEVVVDPETGMVEVVKVWVAHDCGKAINPQLVEGQIEGSVYMGVAEAVLEAQLYDSRGLHLGPSLLDYGLPTSVETPEILARIVESMDPGGPYGAKEAGEGPLHPAIPAISNAIHDAVGIRMRRTPFSPERILAALQAQAGARAPAAR